MGEARVEVRLRVFRVCVLFTLGLVGRAHERLHANLALNGHCFRVRLQLAPLSLPSLRLLHRSLPSSL